jgi:MFS family permease
MMSSSSAPQGGVVLPLSDLRRRLAFALILAAAFGASLVFSVIPPVLPALARHFGGGRAGELSAQFALTMPSLGWLIGGAASGWVVSRLGLRPVIVAAILGLGLFGALGGIIADVKLFAAARFALGFSTAFLITACATLLANIYDDEARPKMIGYMKAMSSGSAVPIAIAVGALAQGIGWRAPFALYAVFGVAAAVFALFATPAAPRASSAAPKAKAEAGAFRALLPILVLIFFLHILPMMGVAQLPFVMAEKGAASPAMISGVMVSSAVFMSIGAIASGYMQARIGPWRVLLLGVFLAAGGYALIGLAPTWQLATAGNALGIFGCGLYFPQYLTLPLSRVSPSGRAMAIGLSQAALYLGAFANPFILSPFRDQFGLSGAYVAVAAIAAAAALVGVAWAVMRGGVRARAAAPAG